tara:strand:+ start:652 stop:1065 length:414 start_codon:yes stop_codon:yes gene_type:complete
VAQGTDLGHGFLVDVGHLAGNEIVGSHQDAILYDKRPGSDGRRVSVFGPLDEIRIGLDRDDLRNQGVMERVMGIEPTLSAWEAEVLPLNYTRFHLAWCHLLAQHDTDKKRCSHNPWKHCTSCHPGPAFRGWALTCKK